MMLAYTESKFADALDNLTHARATVQADDEPSVDQSRALVLALQGIAAELAALREAVAKAATTFEREIVLTREALRDAAKSR